MAGLRESGDAIEAIGIERAQAAIARADVVLWLGPEGEGPSGAWEIEPQIDRADHPSKRFPRFRVSAVSGEGLAELRGALIAHAGEAMPRPGQTALNRRQRGLLETAREALESAAVQTDPLLLAENLRQGRLAFDRLVGRTSTEDVLDALFGRFCIGK
jgi:tRNA modification GTPase